MTDRYAVFGNPIAHSRSPDIHARFAAATGQSIRYDRQLVELGHFDQAAREFLAQGGKGMNVTVPFKEDAFGFADQLTERAEMAGAVNTLALREDGSVLGDNTDGAGLVRDITANLRWPLLGKRVLLLGAGGAVRGVLEPILAAQPLSVTIANRTRQKAVDLAQVFAARGQVRGCGFDELDGSFDLLINGTSASLAGELPPLPNDLLAPGACCYDMMYGREPTVFMSWAAEQGAAAVADGLGMLVEQAAESFFLWRGVRPETGSVIEWLREMLNGR